MDDEFPWQEVKIIRWRWSFLVILLSSFRRCLLTMPQISNCSNIIKLNWKNCLQFILNFIHWILISPVCFVYHFDPSLQQIDGWTIFSPNNNSEDHLYRYFLDNEQTANHQSLIFSLRELNSTETTRFSSNRALPTFTEPIVFTANYELRLYTSSCLYFDEDNQQWKSDGLRVGPETNHFQTQCFFTHI